jgi:hypothetical protein
VPLLGSQNIVYGIPKALLSGYKNGALAMRELSFCPVKTVPS